MTRGPERGDQRRESMSRVLLRSIRPADWPAILQLNEASVELLSPLDPGVLSWLVAHADRSIAVEAGGEVVAFALALAPGAGYGSANYRWFAERYERFLYLDRIVVSGSWRRQGVGTLVYDAMEGFATAPGRLLCEVDLEPPNVPSLGFHMARGYREVGRLTHARGKVVAMLAKELGAEAVPPDVPE